MSTDRLTCPVEGCTNTHGRHLMMCYKHWKKVPGRVQAAVYRAHTAMLAGLEGARARYFEQRAIAIAAAAGARPPQPELPLHG